MLSYDISTLFQQKIDLFDKLIELFISETKLKIGFWIQGWRKVLKTMVVQQNQDKKKGKFQMIQCLSKKLGFLPLYEVK